MTCSPIGHKFRRGSLLLFTILAGALGCSDPAPTARWESAFDTAETGFLSSVWGSGEDDVFIVGGADSAEIYHFDGSDWTEMETPAGASLLDWVFGFGPSNVYAVGLDGTVLQYDGSAWTGLQSPTEQDLWGVWGSAPNNIWIVGGSVGDGAPVILHYDGTNFEEVGLASEQNPFGARSIFKVWGIGEKTFAVGQSGLIIEWVNGAWIRRPAGESADQDFIALTGNAEDNIVVCGGRSGSRIATYDGNQFTTVKPEGFGGTSACFMDTDGTTYVGGVPGYIGRFVPATGQIEPDTGTLQGVHAIWGDGTCRTFAVGGLAAAPYFGEAIVLDRCK